MKEYRGGNNKQTWLKSMRSDCVLLTCPAGAADEQSRTTGPQAHTVMELVTLREDCPLCFRFLAPGNESISLCPQAVPRTRSPHRQPLHLS